MMIPSKQSDTQKIIGNKISILDACGWGLTTPVTSRQDAFLLLCLSLSRGSCVWVVMYRVHCKPWSLCYRWTHHVDFTSRLDRFDFAGRVLGPFFPPGDDQWITIFWRWFGFRDWSQELVGFMGCSCNINLPLCLSRKHWYVQPWVLGEKIDPFCWFRRWLTSLQCSLVEMDTEAMAGHTAEPLESTNFSTKLSGFPMAIAVPHPRQWSWSTNQHCLVA